MANGMELIAKCRGRWKAILTHFGVPIEYLDGKHHPCPVCGGTDRFRFDDQDGGGTWYCNQHLPKQAGFGLQLVQEVLQCNTSRALDCIGSIIDSIPLASVIPVKNKVDPRPMLNKLWFLSNHLTGSDTASLYLHSRGLVLTPRNVRYNTNCYESDSKKQMNALIARIQNAEGKPIGLHRIYLKDNCKAPILMPKKTMPATESLRGSSIRLFSSRSKFFEAGVLGIAEGIETAIACSHYFQIATWACLTSTLMPSWLPPKQIRRIGGLGRCMAKVYNQKAKREGKIK
jgi:putative DNA primase/helicase